MPCKGKFLPNSDSSNRLKMHVVQINASICMVDVNVTAYFYRRLIESMMGVEAETRKSQASCQII